MQTCANALNLLIFKTLHKSKYFIRIIDKNKVSTNNQALTLIC